MKKNIIFILMLCSINIVNAQININPDPNGDPWLVGGVPEITPEIQSEIDAIPEFELNPSCLMINLPSSLDNSEKPFMREIFYQKYNSCAQASTVGYMFTYEINYLRNLTADHDSSMYHPAFTYNFLNYGSADSGSRIDHGLRILEEMGCPSIQTYDKTIPQADPKEWITGYKKYDSALSNRITGYETIDLVSDSGLYYLKHWLADHNSEDTVGGLSVFAVKNMFGCIYEIIECGPEVGKSIITSCTTTVINDAHALTVVGYNDSIRFDLNNNNTYEENELGAFKVANSWGSDWPEDPDSGYCYILYSLFSDDSVFLNGEDAYICYAMENYEPEITIKAKMTHGFRDHFSGQFGYDSVAGSNWPYKKPEIWPITYHIAGDTTLTGFEAPNDTLNIELDFTFYYNDNPLNNLGRIFFRPRTFSPYTDEGMLWYCSLVDHRWNDTFELPLNNIPGPMEYGEQWSYSVDYDLLPFSIDSDTILTTNQIYRLTDTIQSGASLSIGDTHTNTELHLHDATVLIEEGACLYLRSWSSLIAKTGANTIIVKGNLILDEHVIIKAEDNATLTIEFDNDTLNWHAFNDSFYNIELTGHSLSSLVDECSIYGSNIHLSSGTIAISNNSLFYSTVKAYHPQYSAALFEVKDNYFNYTATGNNSVITIEDYPNFNIEENEIYYRSNYAVELFYSGLEGGGDHLIFNNTVRYTGLNGSSPEVGIHSYFSNVEIELNRISNSDYGIAGFHRSDLIISGDSTSTEASETQQIYNNRVSQCIFSIGSFPGEFHWNILGDTASLTDKPHIKVVNYDELIHDTTGVRDWEGDPEYDVTYNCWILNDTNPESRLVPIGAYTWQPIWCPGDGHGHEMGAAESAYYTAESSVESENYNVAEEEFKDVILSYPESIYAQASLKSLFAINHHIYGSSYTSFKTYCDSMSVNSSDSLLGVTAGWLSIHCNIKDGFYQQAVTSLDEIISNPLSLEDSIYALIDLGYVYSKIEDTTNQRSILLSTHSHLIPKTYKKYVIQRDIWIEELLKSQESKIKYPIPVPDTDLGIINAKISSTYPNPASRTMDIILEIIKEGTYHLKLYSLTGQKLLQTSKSCSIPGRYSIRQDVSKIPSGIYFLVLQGNGAILDTRKLVKSNE